MSNWIQIISVFLLLVVVSSCKKQPFQENESENIDNTVFKIDGSIDGENFILGAGVDGYILNTHEEEISPGNYELVSEFVHANCSDCYPTLTFRMKTNTGLYSDDSSIDDVLKIDSFHYDREIIEEISRLINLETKNTNSTIEYTVINGFYTEQDEIQTIPFLDPIILDYSYIENTTDIDNDHWFSLSNSCERNRVRQINTFGLNYENETKELTITPPVFETSGTYSWLISWQENNVVQTTVFDSQEPFLFELDETISYYNVNLHFSGLNGDIIIQRQNHIDPTFDNFEIPMIAFNILEIEQQESPMIQIEYTTESGEVYSSSNNCNDMFHQNIENTFEITSVEDYITNAIGNPTKLVEFSTNLDLINEDGEVLTMDIPNGVIAFPLPQ